DAHRARALLHLDAHVKAALRANAQIGFEVAMENHLPAAGALVPQILGNVGLAHQSADLGSDEIGQPAHGPSNSYCRARRTPAARSRTSARVSVTPLCAATPSSPDCAPIRLTRAEPTTAASATLAM